MTPQESEARTNPHKGDRWEVDTGIYTVTDYVLRGDGYHVHGTFAPNYGDDPRIQPFTYDKFIRFLSGAHLLERGSEV